MIAKCFVVCENILYKNIVAFCCGSLKRCFCISYKPCVIDSIILHAIPETKTRCGR